MGTEVTGHLGDKLDRTRCWLGFSQWEVRTEGAVIGRVIIDMWKTTAVFTAQGKPTVLHAFLADRSFDWWVAWVTEHGTY